MIRRFAPAAATEGYEDVGNGPAGPGPYQPSFRPTADGSAVEYVIVTSTAMAAEFQRLADWKTRKGVQAVVRTVEWIDQTYPNGVDRAERIRFFLRDAYQNWGALFALLGGDTDVVPPRYAMMVSGEAIPADMYYGCLEGNWNADGDARFGESRSNPPGDNADLYFDVTIGRAPVSTAPQAQAIVNKLLAYEENPPSDGLYPASWLALAERLDATLNGATLAEEARAYLPPWMRVVRLYEESANYPGSIELTRQGAIDSIDAGFGIVHHVGHGFRNSMSVGPGTLSNTEADAFVNGPRNSVVFAINCSSASIDFNAIGERFVKNPAGGAVAYVGTSRDAHIPTSRIYQGEWYRQVFRDSVFSLGLATDRARNLLVPVSPFDSSQRRTLLMTTLLGDPETDMYVNAVIPIAVTHPASVPLGSAPITVTVTAGGLPLAGATVTLWKANEAYARGKTAANGQLQLPIGADTAGNLTLTVHKSYYRPYTAAIPVTAATGPVVFIQSLTVDDDTNGASSGDGDGQADAGETVELRVALRNGGTATVTGLTATLAATTDSLGALSILQDTVSYGTLVPGGISLGSGPFVIAIAADAPVAYQPVLTLTATGDQGTWSDVRVLPLRRPYLEHYAHAVDDAAPRGNGNGIVEAGEEIHYRVTLRNAGQDRAMGVTGTLRALRVSDRLPHPLVTVTDVNATFGTLPPGQQVEGDRFAFTLDPACAPATVLLELTLADALGPADLQFLDVLVPTPPDSFKAFGSPTSIRLTWRRSQSADTRGYDIYRGTSPGGPFDRVNSFMVEGTAAFEDGNLPGFTRFYYKVAARDSSFNASPFSAVFSSTTSPPYAAGWPIETGQQTSSSVIIADVDGGPHMELLVGSDMLYAWHGDGTELVDGDDNPSTSGPISLLGRAFGTAAAFGFPATPAAGNMDGVGDLEIANVSYARDSLYVWDTQGEPMPGWPKTVLDDFNWASPVMADLDGDGDLEIVVSAAREGRVFAWHHDGTELVDGDNDPQTDGILAIVSGAFFTYGSPAVGNLDADPELEIVIPYNIFIGNTGPVYAFNIDGTVVPGWPFLTGAGGVPSQVSSSPVIADLDGDGDEEVIIVCERNFGTIYVLNGNGTSVPGWPQNIISLTDQGRLPSPSVGDINADGSLDLVFLDTDGRLYAFQRTGQLMPGFPVWYYPEDPPAEGSQSTASLADIDGDGFLEILFGDEAGRLHGYNHDATLAAGFPIQLTGEVRGTPAVWDLDRDGKLELAVACFDASVYVWDLQAEFNPARIPWPFFRHDTRNTGRFQSPVQPNAVAEPGPAPLVAVPAFRPARPNPFNPVTTLSFDVPGEAGGARPVTLAIYDVNGRLLRELVAGPVGTGSHAVRWDGRTAGGQIVGSGVYFARISIGGDFSAAQKLVVIR